MVNVWDADGQHHQIRASFQRLRIQFTVLGNLTYLLFKLTANGVSEAHYFWPLFLTPHFLPFMSLL
jgi:hypothetical protein